MKTLPRFKACWGLGLSLGLALVAWAPHARAQASSPSTAPSPVPACRQMVASGNPQYPPYLWHASDTDDRLVGANAEMLAWLSRELGVSIEARYVGPWGRVQEEMRAGRVDLIAGAFFTLARTEYMDYFYPALRDTRSVVLVREASRLNYRRWSDLAPLHGVTVIGNSFGEEFDRFARDRLNLAQVASLDRALQMLQRSRADYLVYEDSPAAAYLARLNIKGVKAVQPAVAGEPLYLTLSHRSPCNTPEMRGRIARALYTLARQGLMNGWVEQGIERWKRSGG